MHRSHWWGAGIAVCLAAAVIVRVSHREFDRDRLAFCPKTFDSDKTSDSSGLDSLTAPYAGPGPHPTALFDVFASAAVSTESTRAVPSGSATATS